MRINIPKSKNVAQEQAEYWTALGLFVHAYAGLESNLFSMLQAMAGMPRPVARALFSGLRVEGAIQNMGRLLEISSETQPVKDEWKDVFNQVGHINSLRNSILHYGFKYSADGEMVSSNLRVALDPTRLREFDVSAEILKNATADLGRMHAHCFLYLSRNNSAKALDDVRPGLLAETQQPWRYKPPAQPSPNEPRQSKLLVLRRQRPASGK